MVNVVPESSNAANLVVVIVVSEELEERPKPCKVTSYSTGLSNPDPAYMLTIGKVYKLPENLLVSTAPNRMLPVLAVKSFKNNENRAVWICPDSFSAIGKLAYSYGLETFFPLYVVSKPVIPTPKTAILELL